MHNHRQRTAIINLNLTLRLDKISVTLVLLSFSFKKLHVIQCFKSCKNDRIQFLIITQQSLSKKKKNIAYHQHMNDRHCLFAANKYFQVQISWKLHCLQKAEILIT